MPYRLPFALVCVVGALLVPCRSVQAYDPGTGTLYSDGFEAGVDEGWEQGNGLNQPSPWTIATNGSDHVFLADGIGPVHTSPTRHWARRIVHPTRVDTFSVAFEIRADLGVGAAFFVNLEQRAPVLRKLRMSVAGDGSVTLWRTEAGAFVAVASAGAGTVPSGTRRWIRFGVEPGPGTDPVVGMRVWGSQPTSEPSTWTVSFEDALHTVERVHRFELEADGPAGVETEIDDLDVFGDVGQGVDSSVRDIYIAELSHLDIGFTEPPDDIEAFAKSHLDLVLDNLDAEPDYRWCIESAWWLDRWWERSDATARARMLAALSSGRVELAAGYANLTTTMTGHEQLARNVYWTSRFAREQGVPVRTWITDDVPGSSFAVPEIIARSGLDHYLGGMNTSFGGSLTEPDHGDRPFWWEAPDGSRALSWITFDSYAEAFQYGFSFFDGLAELYSKLAAKLPEQEEAGYPYPELMILRGFDNHYQGFKALNLARQWNSTYPTPVFHLATPSEFLDLMRSRYDDASFPAYGGDFGAAWARSRANAQHTHAWIREAHRTARAAEAFLAVGAALDGEPFPRDSSDFLYRKLLESDEHTGAGGWPGYFTPEEMDRNNRIHLGYATDALDTAAGMQADGLDRALAEMPASGDAVVAVNPLGRPRDGWIRAALPPGIYDNPFRVVDRVTGTELPYQGFDAEREIVFHATGIPAMGYRAYDLVPGDPGAPLEGTLSVTGTTLENDHYRLILDPADGSVASLVELGTGRELVDASSAYDFNELAYNTHNETTYQIPPNVFAPGATTAVVLDDGPLVASIRVTRDASPHVETIYRLYRGEDRVEIENVLDRDRMPFVPHATGSELYTVTLPFDVHDFQIRSETTTRFVDPLNDGFPRTGVFDWHNAEHSLAFWDDSGGLLYAVDTVAAHHFENLSGLTSAEFSTGDALLLSRMYDKTDEYEYSGDSIGPVTVEPDTSSILRYVHHLRATPPSFDPVETSRFGFEALNAPLVRVLSRGPGNLPSDAAAFLEVDAPGVLLYTAKGAEVGAGMSLRLAELTGAPVTARIRSDVLEFDAPQRVEHDEEGGTPLAIDGEAFLVDLGPYETATVRVEASAGWAPIVLSVDKNPSASTVVLSWTGGVTPFTLERADSAAFTQGRALLVDEAEVSTHADPVLFDGATYFYLVR